MTDPALLTTATLLEWSGYRTPGHLRRWLDEHAVPYLVGRDGPVTTVSAVEAALGVRPGVELPDEDWSVVSRAD